MNEKELYAELRSMLPRVSDLITKVDIIDTRTKNIEGGLVGNEFNNYNGLVTQFKEHKQDYEKFKEEIQEEVKGLQHHKTGMKVGIGIITFIATSTIFIKFSEGVKWLWDAIFK